MKMNTTTTAAAASDSTKAIIKKFENEAIKGSISGDTLQAFATFAALATLKGLAAKWGAKSDKADGYDGTKRIDDARRAIMRDKSTMERMRHAMECAMTIKDINTLFHSAQYKNFQTISEYYDLVQVTALAALEVAEEYAHSDGWLTKEVEVLERTKSVLREGADPEYRTVAKKPIQLIFSAVRRAVRDHRSFNVNHKYSYYSDLQGDDLGTYYRRLPVYQSDLGANENERLFYIIESAHLSDRQTSVLSYRLKGFSERDIAARLGIAASSVHKTLQKIAKNPVFVELLNAYTAK